MNDTMKFAVSISKAEFKVLEAKRRKAKATRSRFVRDAVRAWGESPGFDASGVKEGPGKYESSAPPNLADREERRRRAIAAAGRFRSGLSDLSSNHDRHSEDAYAGKAEKGKS